MRLRDELTIYTRDTEPIVAEYASWEFTAGDDEFTVYALAAGAAGNSIRVRTFALNENQPLNVGGSLNNCSIDLEVVDNVAVSTAQEVVDAINALDREYYAAVTTGDGSGIVDAAQDDFLAGGVDGLGNVIEFEEQFNTASALLDWVSFTENDSDASLVGGQAVLDTGATPGRVGIRHAMDTEYDQWYYFRTTITVPALPSAEEELMRMTSIDDFGFNGVGLLFGLFIEPNGELYSYYGSDPLFTATVGVPFTLEWALKVDLEDADEGGYNELAYMIRVNSGIAEEAEDIDIGGFARIAQAALGSVIGNASSDTSFVMKFDDFAWGTLGWIEDAPGDQFDRYGNPIEYEAVPVAVPAHVTPARQEELEGTRDTRLSRYSAIVPEGTSVDALARVEWQGRSFEVIGEPRVYTYRNGNHHLEFWMEERLG